MTRIIAGIAGSLLLEVPDAGTRPTSDRVRESLFGSLEAAGAIEGAHVLDLFAGSGALGLEAISRGAVRAELVEKAARAARVTEKNAARVRRAVADAEIRVHRADVGPFLSTARGPFDLVFVDPPYDLTDDALGAALRPLPALVSADAVMIIERASRSAQPMPAGFTLVRERRYGDTTLWWFEPST